MNIAQAGDPLHPVEPAELLRRIREPKPAILALIERLRALRAIDAAGYARQKKLLPYVVCGSFRPAVRRKEAFQHIAHFILDLDHVAESPEALQVIRKRLWADPEVAGLFASPGGDGLKLLFRLRQPCYDAGLYSAFYKVYVAAFAQRHALHDVIDRVTSDVSRACFISADPEACYRGDASLVDLEALAPESRPEEVWAAEQAAVQQMEEGRAAAAGTPLPAPPGRPAPADDVLLAIRKKLNPNARQPAARKAFDTPPQLEAGMARITAHLLEKGIALASATPIYYGKKLRTEAGGYWAEVNVFFGSGGFKAVVTPKGGSHAGLAALTKEALEELLPLLPTVAPH